MTTTIKPETAARIDVLASRLGYTGPDVGRRKFGIVIQEFLMGGPLVQQAENELHRVSADLVWSAI